MPLKKVLSAGNKNVASPKVSPKKEQKIESKYVRILLIALVIFCTIYLLYMFYNQDKIKINRYVVAVGLLIFFIMMQSRIN